MGHRKDFWEPVRRYVIPKVGLLVSLIEEVEHDKYYHSPKERWGEFVGRVEMDVEQFEEHLHDWGYQRNPFAWLKVRPDGEKEESSWRKIDGYDMQYHVYLYDGEKAPGAEPGETFVYAHYESRWDTHPKKHFTGVGYDAKEGVLEVRNDLEDAGINYEYVQPG